MRSIDIEINIRKKCEVIDDRIPRNHWLIEYPDGVSSVS